MHSLSAQLLLFIFILLLPSSQVEWTDAIFRGRWSPDVGQSRKGWLGFWWRLFRWFVPWCNGIYRRASSKGPKVCYCYIIHAKSQKKNQKPITFVWNCEQCFHCCWVWWRMYLHKCLSCWRNCDGVHINLSGPTAFKETVSPDSRGMRCQATPPFSSSPSIFPLFPHIFALHLLIPLNLHNLASSLRQHIRGNLDRTSRTQLWRIKPFRKCLVLIYFPANALRLKSVSNTHG